MTTTTDDRTTTTSTDPATGEVIAVHGLDDAAAVDAALARAAAAQRAWSDAPYEERAEALRAIAAELRASQERLAALITAEMGKTLHEARAEIDKSAWACEYYADHGAEYLAAVAVETDWTDSYVQHEPLGVVLAIMPWNYPVWQVVRAAAPALMAGNTIVLKHAANVTGCALALAEAIARAVPDRDLLEVLVLRAADVADVIGDPRIAAVTLTGSEYAGVQVATVCARHLQLSVLELGGSDPFIVLADADVEAAAAAAVTGRFLNAGQSCIAAKRFVVDERVADAFEEAFAARTATLRMGDPRTDVDLGPMARLDLRDELADQVRRGVAAGGRVLTGGTVPQGPGAYYEPTIVGGVDAANPLAAEETFGPAAAVLRVPDDRQAIAVANATPYGLSSSIWTQDVERARAMARHIQAGAVFVNAPSASDPRMPFGGVKRSGWGRELGAWGIREFVNVQTVTIAPRRG